MQYPASLEIKQLEEQHPHYRVMRPVWETINDLVKGGHQLYGKREHYLRRRPDEPTDLYQLRLERFTYTNVLQDCLREYSAEMTKAPLHVSGVDKGLIAKQFWPKFREATDGKRRNERKLIQRLFMGLLTFGVIYAFIDKTKSPEGVMVKTRADEEQFGIRPYVVTWTPLDVINWGEQEEQLSWVKARQEETVTSPTGESYTLVTWTIIDNQVITRYQARKDDQGRFTAEEASQVDEIQHGRKGCPVIRETLPDHLWVANQAYLKAMAMLQVENAWLDSAIYAGYVQRVYEPLVSDPGEVPLDEIQTGNENVLIGKSFKFEEVAGSSLQVISEYVLDKLASQIRAIVSLGQVSGSKGVLEQSGLSKQFDLAQFTSGLQSFGEILCELYQDILQGVAEAQGLPQDISVTGLDTFELDSLQTMLDQSEALVSLESKIPPTALKLWFSKLSALMNRSASAEEKAQVSKELEVIWTAALPGKSTTPGDIKDDREQATSPKPRGPRKSTKRNLDAAA